MGKRTLKLFASIGITCMLLVSCVLAGCTMHFSSLVPTETTELSAHLTEETTTEAITEAPVASEDFLSSLKNLFAQDPVRDKVSAAGQKNTCRLILTNVEVNENELVQYGASSILTDEYGNAILQFANSDDCNQAMDQLSDVFGAGHVEKDKYVNLIPETSIASNRVNGQGTRGNAGELSYGPEMIGSPTFISKMSATQKNQLITVAVVDTGVDTDHPFLQGRLVSGASAISSSYEDGHGHGTHVSGIIVDSTADCNIKIMPVQVLDASGSGTNSGVAAGINWAVSHGANVINLSLGGYNYGDSYYIDQAISNALNKGVTVVVAAGNDGGLTDYFCPAHIEAAITVGAVDSRYNLAYFSNYGSAVDVTAPGVDVYSTVIGGYESWSGTSMAAPFASAAAALLLEAKVATSPNAVSTILRQYSLDCGAYGWDQYYGAGVVNLKDISPQAVEAPTEAPTTRPTEAPTARPTEAPTVRPTQEPTERPTEAPTVRPTEAPTVRPTEAPTMRPTEAPTVRPTEAPTERPTERPTQAPTQAPTEAPTERPTERPTQAPEVPSGYAGSSISVSSYGNGTLYLTTDADVQVLIVLVDGVDAHSKLEYLGNNQYRIKLPYGGHTYSISSPTGSISSSGTF